MKAIIQMRENGIEPSFRCRNGLKGHRAAAPHFGVLFSFSAPGFQKGPTLFSGTPGALFIKY
jgi:hypothetical protein